MVAGSVLLGPPIKALSVLLCHTKSHKELSWQLSANVITVSKFKYNPPITSPTHLIGTFWFVVAIWKVSNTSFYYSFCSIRAVQDSAVPCLSLSLNPHPHHLDSYGATCLLSFCSSGVTSPPVKPRSLMR